MNRKSLKALEYIGLAAMLLASIGALSFWILCSFAWSTIYLEHVNYYIIQLICEIIFVAVIFLNVCLLLLIEFLPIFKKDITMLRKKLAYNMCCLGVIILFCGLSLIFNMACMYSIIDNHLYNIYFAVASSFRDVGVVLDVIIIFIAIVFLIKNAIEYRDFTTLNKNYYVQKIKEEKHSKQQKIDAKISKLQQEKEELEDKSEKAS